MKEQDVFEGSTRSKPRDPEPSLGLEDFQVKFRKAFHREMTPEEKKFFHLAEQILKMEEDPQHDTTPAALGPRSGS